MKRLLALVLALVLAVSAFGCGKKTAPAVNGGTTGSTGTTGSNGATDPTNPKEEKPKEGVYLRDNYSVSDDDFVNAVNTVVGTVGEQTLTNGVLQMYYWSGVYSFLNENGYYIYYYGLDLKKGLEEQKLPQEDSTWQQFFLNDALTVWHRYQALALKNDELKLEMDPDLQKELDETEKLMQESAKEGKFETVEDMLIANMGAGATMDNYMAYTELFYRSYNYYLHMYDQIEITDQQIEDYFKEHEKELKDSGLTKETMQYDVRHILIEPKGGTEDNNGNKTYTDAEMEACKDEAQKLLDQWLADNPTEESFADLAKKHSKDPGSAENGGLYEGLTEQTNFVESFKAWYLDDTRKAGDYGLVKSNYGYHIMYFSGSDTVWQDYCREALANEESAKFVNAALEEFPMETVYDKIALPVVDLDTSEEK